jgi:hypothetical protein
MDARGGVCEFSNEFWLSFPVQVKSKREHEGCDFPYDKEIAAAIFLCKHRQTS